ncbi:UDP-3-O-(3-hydroxymyristoyl)glucosamine N-acyltransferase [Granulicella cerasi]|uniref:UDP-3-O-(3-hydroxymyristoyl)glucosamine N-acyltransferase n=1 Tax=Granulicella cerasi TaxID=741063 RepID=A0ABW1ZEB5_9BACT|nr:UDP-3-O-(3-hydroxymyristoyl)glucosamine N-acyltransferase [Granulicella cerasi]
MKLEELHEKMTHVASAENAKADAVVFAESAESLAAALASRAGAVLTTSELAGESADERIVVVTNPRLEFAKFAQKIAPQREAFVHPSASVDAMAKIGARVYVAAGAVVEANAVLGDDVTLGAGAKVLAGVVLGNRVLVQAGAVLGGLGFGYVRDAATGEYTLFPQQGELVIEDDVEIGANSTIDRGALGETRIGKGTKIDNLVHIGHNVRVGRNVVIAAQVGISGSCVIEDGAVLAGQVGISDHCHIGPGVILGGQAGVFRGATVKGPGQMFAGTPAEPIKDMLKSLARLRRLK